jgi:hypothetical protein
MSRAEAEITPAGLNRGRQLYRLHIVRHPQPTHHARSGAHRWGLRVVLALLVLASAVVCQAALSSSHAPADPAPVTATGCHGGLGHDILCAGGIAAVAAPSTRGGRDDAARDGFGPLIALVAALGAAGSVGLAARFRAITGPPPWASQQLVPGRHQLVTIGISRI